MPFFRLFKPRVSLPPPRLRLVVFGTEEMLPWPLQLVHPGALWGAQVGVPAAAKPSKNPRLLLEQPMEEGDYAFQGVHGTVIACVQQRRKGDPCPGIGASDDAPRIVGVGPAERERLENACWVVALELTEVLGELRDALLFQIELADRLADLSTGVVLDQEALRYYLPGKWRVANATKPVDAREHVTVHQEKGPKDTLWVHTHGLSKFGRPELEVCGIPAALGEAACRLLIELSQYLVGGGVLRPGGTVGDSRSPLFLRLRQDDSKRHYAGPSLELVDIGEDGKPLESGGACGVTVHTLAWTGQRAV